MNTEKLEKLKKSLDNKFIPDNMKDKIRAEIKKLEAEIKTDETITASEVKEEVKEIEKKVEKAVEVAEEKEEKAEKKETEKAIKKTAMAVAKTIRKDGEKWSDARKRANDVMKKEKVDAEKTTKSELEKLLARVRKNKSLMAELEGVKDLGRDASRHAKPVGKRVSADGNVYYEYRPNKTDRKTYGKYAFADGGNLETPYNVVYLTKSGRGMIAKNIMAKNEEEAKVKLEKQMRASTSFDKVVMVHEAFELGGSVVTDLAGHNGGAFGIGNHGVLDGFSGTHYTGLVGETNAMSSGEMFANGGSIENQYEGKSAKEVWDLWTEKQKQHFLIDHFNNFNVEQFKGKNLIQISRLEYKNLPQLVRLELDYHVEKGQYANGGTLIGNQKNIDLNHNGKIDAEDFKIMRNTMNGAWRNERNHVNHSENHEVRYARKKPNRTGYKGKRNFEVGGEFMTDPNFGNFQNNIFADGGMIGKEVTFIRHGESGKGIIGGINDDGSFAVATTHSIKLVEPDDILEIHDAPKKSRWFFAKGGYTNERNHVNHSEDYEVRYARKKGNRTGYKGKRKFDDGGNIPLMFLVKKGDVVIAEFKTEEEAKDFIYEYELEHPRVNLELINPNFIPKFSKKYVPENRLSESEWLAKHNSSREARAYAGGGNLNYGIPKEDLENYKIEEVLKDIVDIDYDNSNLEKSKYIILAKPINNNYKNNWYEPKVFIITEKGIYTINNAKKSKWEEIKKDIFDNELTFEKYGYFKIMLNGGKTTFKQKATAIAKKFEGKRVEPKYQKEYGKVYDKAEAKEVGNKIAGSQKAKYDAKAEEGAVVKKNKGNHKMKATTDLARKIRKEGEKWTDAIKRASEQIKNN